MKQFAQDVSAAIVLVGFVGMMTLWMAVIGG